MAEVLVYVSTASFAQATKNDLFEVAEFLEILADEMSDDLSEELAHHIVSNTSESGFQRVAHMIECLHNEIQAFAAKERLT